AASAFTDAEITSTLGIRYFVNSDNLPDWLDAVAGGRTCESATVDLVEREYEQARRVRRAPDDDLAERVRDVWRVVGRSWQAMLETMALAHPGTVLALFEVHGSGVDGELLNVCIRRGPSARLNVAHVNWAVA